MTDHVGAITGMIWASSKGSKIFDTFIISERDEVINTLSINEVPCDGPLSQNKTKKKKGQKGEKLNLVGTVQEVSH